MVYDRQERIKMIIVQYIYKDNVIKAVQIDMEFNRKNCEYVEMMVNKGLLEKPDLYDRFELYETS